MNKSRYIYKSATDFRKKYDGMFSERKQKLGGKNVTVFITENVFDSIPDMPSDVMETVIQKCQISALENFDIVDVVSKENWLLYYVDVASQTYKIYNSETDKLLYVVCEISELRFNAYKVNYYGYHETFVESAKVNWTDSTRLHIEDLYVNNYITV